MAVAVVAGAGGCAVAGAVAGAHFGRVLPWPRAVCQFLTQDRKGRGVQRVCCCGAKADATIGAAADSSSLTQLGRQGRGGGGGGDRASSHAGLGARCRCGRRALRILLHLLPRSRCRRAAWGAAATIIAAQWLHGHTLRPPADGFEQQIHTPAAGHRSARRREQCSPGTVSGAQKSNPLRLCRKAGQQYLDCTKQAVEDLLCSCRRPGRARVVHVPAGAAFYFCTCITALQ
jgi:hypothetical protein